MGDEPRIEDYPSLAHVDRRDRIDNSATEVRNEPMIGKWNPEADAKATEKYFRRAAEDMLDDDNRSDWFEPKILLQSKTQEVLADCAGFEQDMAEADGERETSGFVTKDSGARQEFSTGSVRDTREGKGRYDLLPPYAISRLAAVYERGSAKYGDRNWEKGQPLARFLDSALRHTFQVLEGRTDEDHAAQAAWNLLAFIAIQHRISEGLLPQELNDL